jgi:hypothetical protein
LNARHPRPALSRRRTTPQRRELLVFTEGERTEDGYLVHWRRTYRDRVLVTIDGFHGTPLSLVDRAAEAKRREARDEKKGRGRAHDEVWCVFDNDEHPNIAEALDKAAANGIGIVLSNPCIELWFVLHFANQTAHIERGDAQRLSRQLLGCDKVLTGPALAALSDRHDDAKQRAQQLDAKHIGDGSPPRSNPSSNMWELIERIRSE